MTQLFSVHQRLFTTSSGIQATTPAGWQVASKMPPIVDLFSASSKPMPMVDSFPSQPLQFADTLRPINLNTPLAATAKLPRPRRREESIPKVFPAPPYTHSRHPSTASIQDSFNDISFAGKSATVGTDEWMQQKVDRCLDDASGNLEIT